MTNSQIFKKAHKLAKSVHVAGDCYRVTFGAALKIVFAEKNETIIKKRKIRSVATVFAFQLADGIRIVYEFEEDKGFYHDALLGGCPLYGHESRLASLEDARKINKPEDYLEDAWRAACVKV